MYFKKNCWLNFQSKSQVHLLPSSHSSQPHVSSGLLQCFVDCVISIRSSPIENKPEHMDPLLKTLQWLPLNFLPWSVSLLSTYPLQFFPSFSSLASPSLCIPLCLPLSCPLLDPGILPRLPSLSWDNTSPRKWTWIFWPSRITASVSLHWSCLCICLFPLQACEVRDHRSWS